MGQSREASKCVKGIGGRSRPVKKKTTRDEDRCKRNVDHIKKWSDGIGARIHEAEEDVMRLGEWAEAIKEEESQKLRDEELKYEQKFFETRLQFQSELKEAGKLQQAQGSGSGSGSGDVVAGLQAKLPKLVLTKFNGTFQDWPRFWGQFCEAIDKASIAGVTKFSYLRELLAPKLKRPLKPFHLRLKDIFAP